MRPLHWRRLQEAVARWRAEVRNDASMQRLLAESRRANGVPDPTQGAPSTAATAAAATSAVARILSPGASSSVESLVGSYEWEEYATADGFLYYHNVSRHRGVRGR